MEHVAFLSQEDIENGLKEAGLLSGMMVEVHSSLSSFGPVQAGADAANVAKRVHGFIAERGYGRAILYGPAHGCGQMECEYPFIETSSQFVLEEGMTFMVDIFLAEEDMGFRWEDGVIIRNGAPEELSSYKRQINIIEV
jgi:Xaa-Pro aminopeptidase